MSVNNYSLKTAENQRKSYYQQIKKLYSKSLHNAKRYQDSQQKFKQFVAFLYLEVGLGQSEIARQIGISRERISVIVSENKQKGGEII